MSDATSAPQLFDMADPYATTHPLTEVDPELIEVRRIPQRVMVDMQARASKAVWRPAPGRKNSYAVFHDGRVVGLMFLASPVINLGVRDEFLNLPSSGKGFALRRIADMSVCVGIQPLAWHWNIGKLVALLAASDDIAVDHENRYGDPLEWVTTTSLYGKGSQYNRVYKFLGYTKGYGHVHISDERYGQMIHEMKMARVPVPSSRFGDGSNPRMRRIAAYMRSKGERVDLKHGQVRGVYITPAGQGSVTEIARAWHSRWGRPRYERTRESTPPYQTGLDTAVNRQPDPFSVEEPA